MNRNQGKTLGIALLLLTSLAGPVPAQDLDAGQAGDPLAQARQIVAQLRVDLKPVDDQIAAAPFLDALEHHQVSLDSLRAFAGEQYNILRSTVGQN